MSGRPGPSPSVRTKSETSCADLVIKTHIASPVAAVASTLSKGDILEVTAVSIAGPTHLLTSDGQVAGSVLSKDQAKLLTCMSSGTEYVAEILSIKGGHCEIKIRAK